MLNIEKCKKLAKYTKRARISDDEFELMDLYCEVEELLDDDSICLNTCIKAWEFYYQYGRDLNEIF
jgi:hypothetical protein